jgi:hypothetical protein
MKIKMDKNAIKQERQWQVEDAMRTLQRAESIRNDKKLMGDVKKSMMDLQKMVMGGQPKTTKPVMSKPVAKTTKRK